MPSHVNFDDAYEGNPVPFTMTFDDDQTGATVLAQVRDIYDNLIGSFSTSINEEVISLTWTPDTHGAFFYDVVVNGYAWQTGRIRVAKRISDG